MSKIPSLLTLPALFSFGFGDAYADPPTSQSIEGTAAVIQEHCVGTQHQAWQGEILKTESFDFRSDGTVSIITSFRLGDRDRAPSKTEWEFDIRHVVFRTGVMFSRDVRKGLLVRTTDRNMPLQYRETAPDAAEDASSWSPTLWPISAPCNDLKLVVRSLRALQQEFKRVEVD